VDESDVGDYQAVANNRRVFAQDGAQKLHQRGRLFFD